MYERIIQLELIERRLEPRKDKWIPLIKEMENCDSSPWDIRVESRWTHQRQMFTHGEDDWGLHLGDAAFREWKENRKVQRRERDLPQGEQRTRLAHSRSAGKKGDRSANC